MIKSDAYSYNSEEELTGYLTVTGFTVLEKTFGKELGLSGEISPWMNALHKR